MGKDMDDLKNKVLSHFDVDFDDLTITYLRNDEDACYITVQELNWYIWGELDDGIGATAPTPFIKNTPPNSPTIFNLNEKWSMSIKSIYAMNRASSPGAFIKRRK